MWDSTCRGALPPSVPRPAPHHPTTRFPTFVLITRSDQAPRSVPTTPGTPTQVSVIPTTGLPTLFLLPSIRPLHSGPHHSPIRPPCLGSHLPSTVSLLTSSRHPLMRPRAPAGGGGTLPAAHSQALPSPMPHPIPPCRLRRRCSFPLLALTSSPPPQFLHSGCPASFLWTTRPHRLRGAPWPPGKRPRHCDDDLCCVGHAVPGS